MGHHVCKPLELTGASPVRIDGAASPAIAKAHATGRNVRWFSITETRGHGGDGKLAHGQLSPKPGCTPA